MTRIGKQTDPAMADQGEKQIRSMLSEIRRCLAAELFNIVLFPALALPDICGALQAADGLATGTRYRKWFDIYVASRYAGPPGQRTLNGETCYQLRCALLHQGKVVSHKLGYGAVMFYRPNEPLVRHNEIVNGELHLSFDRFCGDMIDGVERWLAVVRTNAVVRRNLAAKVRIRLRLFAIPAGNAAT